MNRSASETTAASNTYATRKPSCRYSLKKLFLPAVLSICIGFFWGLMYYSVLARARMMEGETTIDQLILLVDVSSRLGMEPILPCNLLVDRLHGEIEESALETRNENIGRLTASIIIRGRSCNNELVEILSSKAPLPRTSFFPEFRGVDVLGEDLSTEFENEQQLVLWMLHRINPDRLLLSPRYGRYVQAEQPLDEALVTYWHGTQDRQ